MILASRVPGWAPQLPWVSGRRLAAAPWAHAPSPAASWKIHPQVLVGTPAHTKSVSKLPGQTAGRGAWRRLLSGRSGPGAHGLAAVLLGRHVADRRAELPAVTGE